MSGGGSDKQTVTNQLDPAMRNALFGQNGTGGLFGEATRVYNQGTPPFYPGDTYAGFNETQSGALNNQLAYLNSGAAMNGYNALNQAGQQLMSGGQSFDPGAFTAEAKTYNPMAAGGQSAQGYTYQPTDAAWHGYDPQQAQFHGYQAVTGTAQAANLPTLPGASTVDVQSILNMANAAAGQSAPVYQAAPSGSAPPAQASNPYLQDMVDAAARGVTNNLSRNILPQVRGAALGAGQYGGSRQGIAEGLAMSDASQQIADQAAGIYGKAYDAAQERAHQASLQGAQLANQSSMQAAQLANDRWARTFGTLADLGQFNAGQQNAFGQLGFTTGANLNQFNAGQQNDMQARNMDALNQAGQWNAGGLNEMGQWNAGQANQAGQFNAGQANQASQFNAGQTNQAGQWNADNLTRNDQFNAGQFNNLSQFNASQFNQAGQWNAGAQNDMTRYGGQYALDRSRLLNDQQTGAYNRLVQGAGMINDATQIPFQNWRNAFGVGQAFQGDQQGRIDADRERWDYYANGPWANLGRYANILLPGSNNGSSQVTRGGNRSGAADAAAWAQVAASIYGEGKDSGWWGS